MARRRTLPPSTRATPLRLHEWFEFFGLSDEEVGEHLNVTRVTVNRWINGVRNPSLRDQSRLAELLGIAPADLWRVPNEDDAAKVISKHLKSNKTSELRLPPDIAAKAIRQK